MTDPDQEIDSRAAVRMGLPENVMERRIDRGSRGREGADDAPATLLDATLRAAADRVLARFPEQRRDQVLPILQDVQAETGYLPRELVSYLGLKMHIPFADLYGVVTFYGLLSTRPQGATVLRPCKGISCYLRGAAGLGEHIEAALDVPERQVTPDGRWSWEWMPCLGQCDRAPAMLVGQDAHGPITPAAIDALLQGRYEATEEDLADRLVSTATSAGRGLTPPLLLARCGMADAPSLDTYMQAGGFAALRKAMDMGPQQVIAELRDASLTGRGAAFSTAVKWDLVARQQAPDKYIVLNADESEPGTFNNRVLLEEDPFAILEAMVIAAYTVKASSGFAYVRGEYALATRRLERAIAQMRSAHFLGASILGSGFSFDVEVRRGGGAYICGEETSLFNSIEGYRGEPRSKPPFPTHVGLFGKPTLINNVETLANILPIVLNGGAWFAAQGVPGFTGTKLFCLTGHVEQPGLYELAGGTSLRVLIEECGGGVLNGRPLQAVLIGGATGVYLLPEHIDTPLDHAALRPFGGLVGVGTGAVIVFDDRTDMWEVTRLLAEFFAEESCGQCVPCRVGTRRQVEILHRLSVGAGRPTDRLVLEELGQAMSDASICGLGQTAAIAVLSALRTFGQS